MRIEVSASSENALPRFVVYAETESDRAILGIFTNAKLTDMLRLQIGGSTYECDVHGVTSFNFGWCDWPCPRCRKSAKTKKRRRKK
jgi:hypothetical protein